MNCEVPEHLVDEIDIHPNHVVTRELKAIGLLQGTKAVGPLEELGMLANTRRSPWSTFAARSEIVLIPFAVASARRMARA